MFVAFLLGLMSVSKLLACVTKMGQSGTKTKHSQLHIYKSHLEKCTCCPGPLRLKKEQRGLMKATVYSSEKVWAASPQSKEMLDMQTLS